MPFETMNIFVCRTPSKEMACCTLLALCLNPIKAELTCRRSSSVRPVSVSMICESSSMEAFGSLDFDKNFVTASGKAGSFNVLGKAVSRKSPMASVHSSFQLISEDMVTRPFATAARFDIHKTPHGSCSVRLFALFQDRPFNVPLPGKALFYRQIIHRDSPPAGIFQEFGHRFHRTAGNLVSVGQIIPPRLPIHRRFTVGNNP